MRSQQLDKDKIKESLTIEDLHIIMDDIGGSFHRNDNNGNPSFNTICHGGDSDKLQYYNDNHSFHCFTNCGHMDIYQLVMRAKERQGYTFTFPDTLKHIAQLTGKTSYRTDKAFGVNNNQVSDWDWIDKFKVRPKMEVDLPNYSENVLEVFMPYIHESWHDEGISMKSARKYRIGYYFAEDQITIPHFSIDNKLIGIRSRNLDERADAGMKYIPTTVSNFQYRHLVNYNLFGLNHTKGAISSLRKCLLFEGEKSVLKAEDLYGDDNFTVAVGGGNISSFQRDLILELGTEEVFIAFDKFREKKEKEPEKVYQRAILEYQRKLLRLAHLFTPFCRVYVLWCEDDTLGYRDSPIDAGKDVFEQLLKDKIEIKTKEGTIT